MANIFPPNTNKRFYGIAALVALAAAFVLGGIYSVSYTHLTLPTICSV